MSYVITAPETMSAAAGNLAGLGVSLQHATAAAAVPTTTLAAAANDDVSIAISRVFAAFGQKFQAVSAQAATFHDHFVSLLGGGAAAYLSTEAANAQPTLLGGLGAIFGGALTSVVGGSPVGSLLTGLSQGAGGALSNILNGGLISVLSNPVGTLIQPVVTGLFPPSMPPSNPAADPWVVLFTQTGANLHDLGATWGADPFPFLRQIVANQEGYAQTVGGQLAYALTNLPTTLANAPAALDDLAIQPVLNFNPVAAAQVFIEQQIDWTSTIVTSLQKTGADLQTTIPVFQAHVGLAEQAIAAGHYHEAVQDFTHGALDLFISGFNTSNLSDIKILGPGGDLLPILAIPAQQAHDFAGLFSPGSIPGQIADNYDNTISTLTNTNVSASFALNETNPNAPVLESSAYFGLPLSVVFSLLGAPVSGLNGLATGATALAAAVQTGNPLAVGGALVDMPAYFLNGFLNGETVVNMTLPVSATTALPGLAGHTLGPVLEQVLGLTGITGPTIPVVVHLSFDGLLVPPHPITATMDVTASDATVTQLNLNLGGTPFGGLLPELLNTVPEQLAASIAPG
ncbi:PE family protein [Mycobacterium sp. THU-M104]|uniref:PE family protein n=1 Tax=Mycobacterium sp. THU-M104 TaxID=3410515 RepID=UPI003B991E1F